MADILLIPFDDMEKEFRRILVKYRFSDGKAAECARVFAENSLDGIVTHGANRFSRFIRFVESGHIHPAAEPFLKQSAGSIEQWDGALGPGPLNALRCTDRAMQLAREHGLGCVALSNTNHWMRGGYYGRMAANAGFAFIGWTNTTSNMPAWGALEPRLGNNPLVLAFPGDKSPIVLDMAMSQFSYGKVELCDGRGESLPMPGGFDKHGVLTNDPSAILESRRLLPMGYWKGAGLALLLDLLASGFSGGLPTAEISRREPEYGLSQVFLACDLSQLGNRTNIAETVRLILDDYHRSTAEAGNEILHPGERVERTRMENQRNGIPVDASIWGEILSL